MKKLLTLSLLIFLIACTSNNKTKIPCYAWTGGPGKATDSELKAQFTDLKKKGIDGLMYSAGRDPEVYRRVGKIAKEAGLEFNAWIPTLTQNNNPDIKPEWFAINGIGESTYDKPTFGAGHYHFVCPNRPEVCDYLEQFTAKLQIFRK